MYTGFLTVISFTEKRMIIFLLNLDRDRKDKDKKFDLYWPYFGIQRY